MAETWQTVKIKESEQRLVDQINTLEYEELAPVGDELSDCLQSGRAEGERTQYKVIKSLNDLWAMVMEFTELVR